MEQHSTVTVSLRELDRLKVIQDVVSGELRTGVAAERLAMTARQVRRLAQRHQIVVAKETVRRIQVAARLWIPRSLRAPKIQQPRTRCACVGGPAATDRLVCARKRAEPPRHLAVRLHRRVREGTTAPRADRAPVLFHAPGRHRRQ